MLKLFLKLAEKFGFTFLNVEFLEKLKGWKTLSLGVIVFLIGAMNTIIDQFNGLAQKACEMNVVFMCNIEGSTFYGGMLMVVGFLTTALRFVTNIPIPGTEEKFESKKK